MRAFGVSSPLENSNRERKISNIDNPSVLGKETIECDECVGMLDRINELSNILGRKEDEILKKEEEIRNAIRANTKLMDIIGEMKNDNIKMQEEIKKVMKVEERLKEIEKHEDGINRELREKEKELREKEKEMEKKKKEEVLIPRVAKLGIKK
jgi:hypothetical protein